MAQKSSFARLSVTLMLVILPCQPQALAADSHATNRSTVNNSASAANPEPGSGQERPIEDKWAIVIGIDRFKNADIPQLRFSAKDATDFAKFLVSNGNFAADHVLILTNEAATKDNIRAAIGDTWLPRRVAENDLVVIYASTHGSPKEMDLKAGENFLVAYDTDPGMLFTTGINFADLAPTIKKRTGCDRIVLLLDACNSGAANVGGKGLIRTNNFDVSSLVGQGQVVISSSSSDQRSFESKRYENGVFTKQLIDALQIKGSKTNLSDAFNFLKQQVENEVRFDRGQNQTPIMKSLWAGTELILNAVPSRPRSMGAGAAPVAVAEPTVDLKSAYNAALRLFDAKRYDEAATAVASVAKAGHPDAQNLLGVMYEKGLGVSKSYPLAVQNYELAANQNLAEAQVNLGCLYNSGNGVPQNLGKAAELFQQAANQKNGTALSNLGLIYKKGEGVPQNYKKAAEYYQGAVNAGHKSARHSLALLYEKGLGVPQSYAKAVELLQSAANDNVVAAQISLANFYSAGKGVPQDYSKAMELYERAAKAGEPVALYNIALFYIEGSGVKKDYSKAAEFYQQAADKGYESAQNNLGVLYEKGQGVKKDPLKAAELYQAAANQGNAMAQNNLGWLCENGNGVPKDKSRARELYRLSAAQGNKKAIVNLKRLGN